MSKIVDDLKVFLAYHARLDGDEKGEAHVFCDRLFIAFGHKGYNEAGAKLEYRIKTGSSNKTTYADLVWKPRLIIEMKKRGEKLQLHYRQAFNYWINAVPDRPRYVILCNFDEFWIYDFDRQLDEPVDKVSISQLPARYTALNFLFPDQREPVFNNDREDVSRRAASQTAELFRLLTLRPRKPIAREHAQRFVLQLVVAMFAEDIDLLPSATITAIIRDCVVNKQSSYDLLGALFRQMNDPIAAKGGRYVGVPYFNGGLFAENFSIELNEFELGLIGGEKGAASENWSKVNPAIFGTLFQQSMDAKEQHRHGRHFTSEADIQRIVGPTIVKPWELQIDAAKSMRELLELRTRLAAYRVLDPACGSGNFLYVAFRELARLDIRIMLRLKGMVSPLIFERQASQISAINPKQFFGLDNDQFGVEIAKVTLMLAKKLAVDEAVLALSDNDGEFTKGTGQLLFHEESALPLDNLDDNILLQDAMFSDWPECDVIIGNPPYQSKNKLQEEVGASYIHKLRQRYPMIDGRADFCVYWFRRTHDHLKDGQRAGLVGTNTIRQNYSRLAGLDYIVDNGGTLTEAVSSMVWPGKAAVHVSIVNWIKGEQSGLKRLYIQEGNAVDSGWRYEDLARIPSSLSFCLDVTTAKSLRANSRLGGCYQGQTHGHKAFLLKSTDAIALIKAEPRYKAILKPFLNSVELISTYKGKPKRYVIDYSGYDLLSAQAFDRTFSILKKNVLPTRIAAAARGRTATLI